VELSRETRGGWGVAADGGITVALDLEITPDLAREGLARELVRLVQDARKAAGLEVSDRIDLAVDAGDDVREAVEAHREWVAGEVLATRITFDLPEDGHRERRDLDGREITVAVRKA